MAENLWAIGVDLGGTKIEVARVGAGGKLSQRVRRPTNIQSGPAAVKAEIVAAVLDLQAGASSLPAGVGVGVAGQVDSKRGLVRFAPNLGWRDEPLQPDLSQTLGLPVVIVNDVRAATLGEWLYGAGQGCNDLICLFVGTGIGGGVVSGGQLLSGCSNTAGELGHITIDTQGPSCHCGNQGCLEALAGGWAIARQAKDAVSANPVAGASLLKMAGGHSDAITAEIVAQAAKASDPLAVHLIDNVARALIAGVVSLVNAFNPCRLILGGGVMEGLPELVQRIDQSVRQRALAAAIEPLRILPAQLHNDAGVVGAAALAMQTFNRLFSHGGYRGHREKQSKI
jgi:glucokinase